jgi:chaperone modulatory protein CbpM
MTDKELDLLSGEVVDDTMEITIIELCQSCAVDLKLVEAMIDEGILEPTGKRDNDWCFSYISVKRTRTVVRLQRDLGVNLPGAALALELLERLEKMKRSMR